MQKFDTPLDEVTTSSLEALHAYTLGRKTREEKNELAAIPFFRQAVQLDPNFAMAYERLATAYLNIREYHQSAQNSERAYALRDRVSAKERFHVEGNYYDNAVGDLQKSQETYQLWAQTYPQDRVPFDLLGNIHIYLGQHEQALEELEEERRLSRGGYYNYSNLVDAYMYLGRWKEARETTEAALATKMEPLDGHVLLYLINFWEFGLYSGRKNRSEAPVSFLS